MITFEDKQKAMIGVDEIASAVSSYPAFFKYLIKGLNPALPTVRLVQSSVNDQSFQNGQALEEIAKILIRGIIEDETKEEVRYYTPSELSQYFGVSRQTVNKWVNAGRFTNTTRESAGNHVHISANSFFVTPNGEQIQVKEIIEDYKWQHQELSDKDEVQALEAEIRYFQNKYGMNLANFVSHAEKGSLTAEEKRDLEEWTYFQEEYTKYE